MKDLETTYAATEPTTIPDALGEAATAIRKAFIARIDKHGAEDPEAIRLMAVHKRLIQMRTDYDRDED